MVRFVRRKGEMDSILTLKEMAQILKMNERTVLKMAQTGAIPAAKIGSQWRFKRELVDRWLEDAMLGKPETLRRGATPAQVVLTPVTEMLDERLVKLDLEDSNKTEVLAELVRLLVDTGYLERTDDYLSKLLDREKLMTTALGDGVAFPHPREPQASLFERPRIVVGISPQGVDYDSLDGKPVHVLFLICASDDSAHLRILALLTRIIRSTDVVGELVKVKSKEATIELFARWDQQLFALPGLTGKSLQP
jgi:excisionase family DNA binding protein